MSDLAMFAETLQKNSLPHSGCVNLFSKSFSRPVALSEYRPSKALHQIGARRHVTSLREVICTWLNNEYCGVTEKRLHLFRGTFTY